MADELLDYLYSLDFFENDGEGTTLPYGFVSTYGGERWLCDEEAALLLRWAANDGDFVAAPRPTEGSQERGRRDGAPVGASRRPEPLGSPGCGCHDSYGESYFHDHSIELGLAATGSEGTEQRGERRSQNHATSAGATT